MFEFQKMSLGLSVFFPAHLGTGLHYWRFLFSWVNTRIFPKFVGGKYIVTHESILYN